MPTVTYYGGRITEDGYAWTGQWKEGNGGVAPYWPANPCTAPQVLNISSVTQAAYGVNQAYNLVPGGSPYCQFCNLGGAANGACYGSPGFLIDLTSIDCGQVFCPSWSSGSMSWTNNPTPTYWPDNGNNCGRIRFDGFWAMYDSQYSIAITYTCSVVGNPDIQISWPVGLPGTTALSQTLNLIFRVHNVGNQPGTSTVSIAIPPGIAPASWSWTATQIAGATGASAGSGAAVSQVVTFPSGSYVDYNVTMSLPDTGIVGDSYAISGSATLGPDNVVNPNTTSTISGGTVSTTQPIAVSVTTAPTTVTAGIAQAVATVNVSNASNDTVAGVRIKVPVPGLPGLTASWTSSTPVGSSTGGAASGSGAVDMTIGLGSNSTRQIAIVYTTAANTPHGSQFTVFASADPNA